MNDREPENNASPQPGKTATKRRSFLTVKVLLTSALINSLIILVLFLIVFPPARPNPPSFEVILKNAEQEPDDFANQTIKKIKRPIDPGSTSAGMMMPIVAPISAVALNVPEFSTATSGEIPGMNLGFGPGDGSGYGLGGNGRGGGGGTRMGAIGGMKVQAARLGVVLDVSGSMKEKLPRVRRELKREFSLATIVEVPGCSLAWSGGDLPFDPMKARETVVLKAQSRSVVEAIEMLIATKRVDAIFWFSDLNDSQSPEGLRRVSVLLGTTEESERRAVRFYVRSVGKKPSDALLAIVERSGGGTR